MSIDWLIKLGASNIDVLIFVMGIGWSLYSFNQHRETKKILRDLNYKYNVLNTLVFYLCKEHERETGVKLIKEGANSQGDFGANHGT